MSKNLKSTADYYQPEFYHFSEDSILLAQKTVEILKYRNFRKNPLRGLDLCAGCGVVGIEILKGMEESINMDFCEIQKDFYPFFLKNSAKIGFFGSNRWITSSFVEFLRPKYLGKYDFIVANPPFFQVGHGKLSNNLKRNLCRFFIEGSFRDFFSAIVNCLNQEGIALFLGRSQKSCGFDIWEHIGECKYILRNDVQDVEDVQIEVERIDKKLSLYIVFFRSASS